MQALRLATSESVRISRNRDDVIAALATHGRMTLQEISRATGLRSFRVRAVLHGDMPDDSADRALVPLDIVRSVRSRFGVEYELTSRGVSEASVLAEAVALGRVL